MHHRSALHNPSESGPRPRKKVAWNLAPEIWPSADAQSFPRRKNLYGAALQNLCLQTQHNLARLASFRSQSKDISLMLKMSAEGYPATTSNMFCNDHPKLASRIDERKHQSSSSSSSSSTAIVASPSGALRSRDAIKYLQQSINLCGFPFSDSDVETDLPEPAYTLCYFCSTMEEHRRHIKTKNHKAKPRSVKVQYVAPRPKVRIRSAPPKVETKVNHENLYKLIICTGDVDRAGTTANVYVALEGTSDFLPLTRLKKNSCSVKFCFQRNSKEMFYLRGPFLGDLKYLVVEHSGLEDDHCWFLDSVVVCDVFRQRNWTFKCGQWMSLQSGKRRLRLPLSSSQNSKNTTSSSEEYRITVQTGDCRMAGTDANVFITLYGSHQRRSDKIPLNNQHGKKCFQRGSVDTFVVKPDQPIGEIEKIRIEHDNKGVASGWFLNKIAIESLRRKGSSESVYVFPYNGWLSDDTEGGRLWREIEAQHCETKTSKEEKLKKYQIFTITGSQRYAGTAARVFIQIIGAHEKTSKLALKSKGSCFERGNTDLFEVEAIDVGHIHRIIIGHDNNGVGAGWYLKQVMVRSYEKKEKPTMTIAGESATKRHRKYTKATVRNRLLSNISEISDEDENSKQEKLLSKPQSTNNFEQMSEPPAYTEYTFICEQWMATDEGDGKTSKSLEATDVKYFHE